MRIGYGYDIGKVREGLAKIDELFGELRAPAPRLRARRAS